MDSVGGYGYRAEDVTARAASNGTFTVIVSGGSAHFGGPTGSGSYRLTLAKTGAAIVTAPGDEGGPMTNGWMHTGNIELGDADIWSFSAKAGQGASVQLARGAHAARVRFSAARRKLRYSNFLALDRATKDGVKDGVTKYLASRQTQQAGGLRSPLQSQSPPNAFADPFDSFPRGAYARCYREKGLWQQ